jgi:calcineurin-like phosphoesterase family protein
MIFFTSDLHLWHKNILRFSPDTRKVATMDDMLITLRNNWNAKVGHADQVWLLGDVSFGEPQATFEYLQSLNGIKHLVYGNHDKMFKDSKTMQVVFSSVQDYKELTIDKQLVVMSHYPMTHWNKSHYGSFMLFGHLHGSYTTDKRSMDIGIDSRDDLSLWSWDEILTKLGDRPYVDKYNA